MQCFPEVQCIELSQPQVWQYLDVTWVNSFSVGLTWSDSVWFLSHGHSLQWDNPLWWKINVLFIPVHYLSSIQQALSQEKDGNHWNVSVGNWMGLFSGMNTAGSGAGRRSPSPLPLSTLCVDIVVSYMFYFMLEWSTWIKWCLFWKIVE